MNPLLYNRDRTGESQNMTSTGGWNNPDFSTLNQSFALAPTLAELNITAGEFMNLSRLSQESTNKKGGVVNLVPDSIQIQLREKRQKI